MQKLWTKFCSVLLVLAMILNMIPINVLAEDFSSKETSTITSEAKIVEEVVTKRTEYTKEYLLDNGTFVAAVYNEPVHFQKDGQWKEIDNTLIAKADGTYTNTEGVWNVQFPQQLSNNNNISITKDGYTISFGMAGELRNQGNLEIASMEDMQPISTGSLETASITVDGTAQTFAISSAQISAAQLQKIDSVEAKKTAQFADTVLDKNTSRLMYSNVYSNTDIRYDLQSNRVKESVILKAYDSNLRGYRYTLNTGDLIPVLDDNNDILFYDKEQKNVVMAMPAPFLLDNEFEASYDVQVSLTGKGGVYTLIYLLPQQWLAEEDRAWPVILDPVIFAELTDNNIQDTTVISARKSEAKYMRGTLQIGYSSADKISRVYLGFTNLPPISSSDVIVSATMSLNKVSNSTNSIPAVVHKVNSTWNVETLCWNNKPSYDPIIEDYQVVKKSGRYYWDITDIARDWYANANTGMLIKASDAVEEAKNTNSWKEFYSCNYADDPTDPWLYITFRNNNGLESYWDYTSSSAGRAGTGYVNNYTGNMVWTRSDIGFGGNRMPVSVSHVYNLNDASNNSFGMGYGWRTNFNQRVYKWSEDSNYYIWEDSDGTEHYFYKKTTSTYNDEDGLELTLKTNGTGTKKFSITDKNDNISYFDTHGRLTSLQNNQKEPSSINVTYTTSDSLLIDTITDGAGRAYVFAYNTDNLLDTIKYYGTKDPETSSASDVVSSVRYTYSNGNLINVTDPDNESSEYTYSGNILQTAKDVDGYKLQFTYNTPDTTFQPYRVLQVKEYSGTTEGGELNFEYAHNQTTLTDHNGHVQIMQFNNFGNTVSIQDDEGRAQYAQYAANDPSESGKANQLRLSSKMQNTVNNILQDHSFESSTLWTVVSGTQAISSAQKYLGSKSLALTNTAEVKSATVFVAAGETYTFSAYLKTSGTSAVLKLTDDTNTVSGQSVSSADWTRSEVSFTNNGTSAVSVTARVASSGTGTTYVDCVQLENASTASRYNLVQNGDFQSSTGWSSNAGREAVEGVSAAAPQLNDTVYYIKGAETKAKRVDQTVTVSGAANDTFVVSGWGKGDSVPLPKAASGEKQRQFAVIGVFNYTDGTKSDEFIAQFNPDTDSSANWQFSSQVMVAEKAYSSITVSIAYDYNLNVAYFDGIQLFKEEFGNSYTYDDEGNVISATDLQKQTTSYEYDENNNLTQIIQDNKAKMTYDYDGYRNVTVATSEMSLTYNFDYDDWGNNTSVSIVSDDSTITSVADYTDDGNYLEYTTDAVGNTTYYGYNTNTGVLDWVKYPGDTDATCTNYTYDSMYRMASAAVTTDANATLSAEYTYTNDLLAKIETESTTYDFTYGNFALRNSVKIGNRTLASYTYTTDRNKYLQALEYGNGDSVEYTYDEYGRVIKQTYEDGSTVSYKYDNTGALATVTDSTTGVSTTYYYDFTDRLLRYVESGNNYSHIVGYEYDTINNLTALVETINGVDHTTAYTYDNDNRVTSVTNGNASKEYTYDAWGRSGTQTTKNSSTTVKTDAFEFNSPTGETTSAQIKKHTVTVGTNTKEYLYNYDLNGNITSISDGTHTTSYAYDSANQLIRENNQAGNFTYVWTYDNAGNILSRTEYAYTEGELGTATDTVSYTYGDTSWGDLLTAYDGQTFTYDTIGNLTDDGTWDYTWQHGRQLASMTDGTNTWNFTYNADGLRTKRTNGSTTYNYIYNGDKLSQMTVGSDTLYFTYDAAGTPMAVTYNGTTYYYVTNIQGDVIGILNSSGTSVVEYTYDAWGNILTTTGSMASTFGTTNPLRYRGYVYDQDTELYYLQSRYYDPTLGRFLSSDIYPATGQGLVGNNMFAYCNNSPVIHRDSKGTALETIWDLISLGLSIAEVCVNPGDVWAWVGLAGDVVDVVVPCVGGIGETVRATKSLKKADAIVEMAKATDFTADAADVVQTLDRTSGFTKSTASAGRKIHDGYKATSQFNPDWKEYSDIKGIRPDYVDFDAKVIYELKPNNPRAIRQGAHQLQKYNRSLGGGFKLRLEVY